MFSRTMVISFALLGSLALCQAAPAQSLPRVTRHARVAAAQSSVPVAFDGFVLAPDGTPAAGAVVVSSGGGTAVTGFDGRYRLEVQVPLAAESVQLTAVGNGDGRIASANIQLSPAAAPTHVEPLVLLAADCQTRWLPEFGAQPGVSGPIRALTVFDDGSGPALYAGGGFTTAGNVQANRIVKWDGTSWSTLGSGVSNTVNALLVFDDGSGPALYAGGSFTSAGGAAASRIAKWDGASWSALGSGVSSTVEALTVFDDGGGAALYVGGRFTTAGGGTALRIAKWDGATWSALGSGIGTALQAGVVVHALTVFDDGSGPALYAGGEFGEAGGVAAGRIAKWDGSSWSPLGSGVDGIGPGIWALTTFDDGSGLALYAGGRFSTAGGVAANHIARWDGASWTALGSGMNGSVNALAVFDDGSGAVLVSGSNGPPHFIAQWDGASWSPLHGGMSSSVLALTVFDGSSGPALYAGGFFTGAGSAGVKSIARWDGADWSALDTGLDDEVRALAVFDDGGGPALYAGGDFESAGGGPAHSIAKWNGSSWSALGSGTDGQVSSLAVFDDGDGPALYVGGDFFIAGGVVVNAIAKWDGASWSALGSGMFQDPVYGSVLQVEALAVFDDGGGPALYAGGHFSAAGGVAATGIARWNGSSWSGVSGGTSSGDDAVLALAVFDDGSGLALYAGGNFETAGGVTANKIARWNGASWSALGSGVDGNSVVLALAVFDDGNGSALYAGGIFTTVDGLVPASSIARWDGSSWSALGSGTNGSVQSLTVFDDGSGPALYTGGDFTTAGGVAANRIAKWRAASWSPLGSGTSGPVQALTVFGDGNGADLYAGGRFVSAADSGDSHLAKWGCFPTTIHSKVRRR